MALILRIASLGSEKFAQGITPHPRSLPWLWVVEKAAPRV